MSDRARVIAKLKRMADDFDINAFEAGDVTTEAMWKLRADTIRDAISLIGNPT